MKVEPYFEDDDVSLFLGNAFELTPLLARERQIDLIVTDPPYGATSLVWDRWQSEWPALMASVCRSMWCFGTMKMFIERANEFTAWTIAQDVVWEKHNGSSFAADRFRRVHENAVHFYQGPWSEIYHETVYEAGATGSTVRSKRRADTHRKHRADRLPISRWRRSPNAIGIPRCLDARTSSPSDPEAPRNSRAADRLRMPAKRCRL